MFKDFPDDIRLVDEADAASFEFPQGGELVEPYLSLAFGTSKEVRFINFSDEVPRAVRVRESRSTGASTMR